MLKGINDNGRNGKTQKAAFTLVELVLTLGLFLLVASLVLSFITYMTKFNKENDKTAYLVKQTTALREESDLWFSAFDSREYSLQVFGNQPLETENGAKILARSSNSYGYYDVYLILGLDKKTDKLVQYCVFEYPPTGNWHGKEEIVNGRKLRSESIECQNVWTVAFFENTEDWQFQEGSLESAVRFGIRMRCVGKLYGCEIYTAGKMK